jgi:hypothetical protein
VSPPPPPCSPLLLSLCFGSYDFISITWLELKGLVAVVVVFQLLRISSVAYPDLGLKDLVVAV